MPAVDVSTKDLTDGPFDPDAVVEELEMTRSSAFDAAEKPVVSAIAASKIAVIGEGLSKIQTRAALGRASGSVTPSAISSTLNNDDGEVGVIRCGYACDRQSQERTFTVMET